MLVKAKPPPKFPFAKHVLTVKSVITMLTVVPEKAPIPPDDDACTVEKIGNAMLISVVPVLAKSKTPPSPLEAVAVLIVMTFEEILELTPCKYMTPPDYPADAVLTVRELKVISVRPDVDDK